MTRWQDFLILHFIVGLVNSNTCSLASFAVMAEREHKSSALTDRRKIEKGRR